MHFSVKGTITRHVYATLFGVLIQLYMFGIGIAHVFVLSVVAYLMMNLMARRTQAKYVMWFVLAYLSF